MRNLWPAAAAAMFLANTGAFGETATPAVSASNDAASRSSTKADPAAHSMSNRQWLSDPKSACAVQAPAGVAADSISWSGGCVGGRANGAGTVSFLAHGAIAERVTAAFDEGEWQDGHAKIEWSNGGVYEGSVVAGRMEGSGVLTSSAGDRFEGQWSKGRMNGYGKAEWANGDRYEGEWRDGKANGRGRQVWADGHVYDGAWKDDKPNGHGVITKADGSRYEGEFADGQPSMADKQVRDSAATAAIPAAAPGAETRTETASPTQHDFASFAGKTFFALDGSSFTLSLIDGGISRRIVSASGSVRKTEYRFLGERVGSVTDGETEGVISGVFRMTDKGLSAEYGDGRSETLLPNDGGGVSLMQSAPTGETVCTAWYPQGHAFSLEERKAALAAYADRLGLDAAQVSATKGANKAPCGGASDTKESAQTAGATTGALEADAPIVPVPRPSSHTHALASKHGDVAAGPVSASFAKPALETALPIEVRTSAVHLIDAPAAPEPESVAGLQMAVASAPNDAVNASTCLSIESDGAHWDFRNHCAYDVQFAYCVMNADDPLASCGRGAVTGSVAPNGTSALIADKSLAETNADHDFRWVACGGGAGEVVVHLDGTDPPIGRCVRRGAS